MAVRLGLIVFATTLSLNAVAKDIKLSDPKDRRALIRQAIVWTQQKSLSPAEIFSGPEVKAKDSDYLKLLDNSEVYCQTNEADQDEFASGRTPKFYCQIMTPQREYLTKKNGDRRVIKIKYSQAQKENREIEGEMIGTRLLWALGFYADQMFYVDRVHCYGCTSDPFVDRRVDRSSMNTPRTFSKTVIENKVDGDKISSTKTRRLNRDEVETYWDDGLWFWEMMRYMPERTAKAQLFVTRDGGRGLRLQEMLKYMDSGQHRWATQLAHRDALRLLAIFMNDIDVKGANQRLICVEKQGEKCVKPVMMIQDIGTSFGVRTKVSQLTFDKVNLEVWKKTSLWSDARNCRTNFTRDALVGIGATLAFDATQTNAQISEAGRFFLSGLLEQFISKRARVKALFKAARMNEAEVNQWTDAFMNKVEQLRYPMGHDQPDFRCPPSPVERRGR